MFALIPVNIYALNMCTISTQNVCGQPIQNQGHGAVELCDNCYVCGAADGICPDDFSDGTILPQSDDRTRVTMKIGTDQRPEGEIFTSNDFRLIHSTGNEACEAVSGTCSEILTKTSPGGTLTPAGISCETSVLSESFENYYVAQCQNVLRTASCANCPDPDCADAQIKGLAYDKDTGDLLSNSRITLKHSTNTMINNLNLNAISESDGSFEFEGIRGSLTVQCSTEGYDPVTFTKNIVRGTNIIDCPLGEAQCSTQCTIPNDQGQEVCRASCDDRNECGFNTGIFEEVEYDFAEVCDGRRVGSFVILGRENSTHVTGVECCTGVLESVRRPQFSMDEIEQQEGIRNVITRDYNRDLEDETVTVRIVVYER